MFFEPLPKCSWGLFNVVFITFHPVTFVSIHCALFGEGVFAFESHQEAFDSIASSEVYMYPMFITYILKALTQAFGV